MGVIFKEAGALAVLELVRGYPECQQRSISVVYSLPRCVIGVNFKRPRELVDPILKYLPHNICSARIVTVASMLASLGQSGGILKYIPLALWAIGGLEVIPSRYPLTPFIPLSRMPQSGDSGSVAGRDRFQRSL